MHHWGLREGHEISRGKQSCQFHRSHVRNPQLSSLLRYLQQAGLISGWILISQVKSALNACHEKFCGQGQQDEAHDTGEDLLTGMA